MLPFKKHCAALKNTGFGFSSAGQKPIFARNNFNLHKPQKPSENHRLLPRQECVK
jgi:hypothetical protein